MSDNIKGKILVVDDTPASAKVVEIVLMEAGYQVSVATSGEKALDRISMITPDLILLDIMMPGIDGYETCRRLKKEKSTQSIPVIFLSALAETFDKVKGFDLGAVDYVIKPIAPEELLSRVHAHIRLNQLKKQLEHQNVVLLEEITQRERAEESLRRSNEELESRVVERTADLAASNNELLREIEIRKQVEGALVESEEKYRSLVENVHIGVFQNNADENGNFIWANQAMSTIFGYESLDEFLKIPATDLYVNPEKRMRYLSKLLTDGFIRNYENQMKKRDGTPIWTSVTAHTRYGPDGSIQWIEGFLEDVTDHYQIEELKWKAFAQIEKNIEQFAILNDQIRNPLSIILTFVSESDMLFRDIIEQQVQRIDDLIDQLDKGYVESEKVSQYLRKHRS